MIKLSRLTDYAVVIMAEMAKNKSVRMSASALSVCTALPEATVAKVLKILTKDGLINSTRGVNGGYMLVIMPDDLNVRTIIEAMEGPITLASCVKGSQENCALEGMCGVNGRWTPVNAAIKAALAQVTLTDMLGRS